ncbi:DNA-binding SARP family transcriptional activator [Kitasatospora sp. MAP12-15]|uniref:AfsR/SARP family transcriptional regulator n=1 Tax=unclassified Kitasatospora TaxID=2633591 RepID=UPI0024743F54|nr:AfsR/SARP family transcriptional regulator [Kitasatospora sp. MAP12-44]MDH6113711.1 DNA-binding SARP family transcriptional activator [Kitasatospora sp. MAP12-44]
MEFQLLGPVEVRQGNDAVPLSGTKIHTVLAVLLLNRGTVVSDERLSNALWGWDPPATRSAQIYTYVSRLRKRLGPEVDLVRHAQGYLMHPGSARLDLEEFERSSGLGREALEQHRYYDASVHLRSALALWQGPALANVTDYLSDAERPSLDEARVVAVEDRIEADLVLGRQRELVPELTGLLAEHPLRERLRAQLMTALYRCDRQADALTVYQAGRRVLAEELGVDPGPVLIAVHQSILRGTPIPGTPIPGTLIPGTLLPGTPAPGAPAQAPGAQSALPTRLRVPARPVPAMVPPELADFAGREAELADIRRVLAPQPGSSRAGAVLLTGMPGIGKSALATQAAHACRDAFPDGQLYTDLRRPDGSPKNPWEVLVLFLHALGLDTRESADLDELVSLYRAHTAGKRLLVVLDRAASDLQIGPLLPNDPGVGVIITSRGHLATGGHTVTVPLLDDEQALDLLASITGPERILENPAATQAIIEACAGLPLALRIAGLRLATRPHWSTGQLARRLAAPSTRLDELSFGELAVGQRLLSSLRGVSPQARTALPQLAAISTPHFPAELAAAVLGTGEGPTEQVLDDLVGARLLEVNGSGSPFHTEYGFHELVRLLAHNLRGPAVLARQGGHAA